MKSPGMNQKRSFKIYMLSAVVLVILCVITCAPAIGSSEGNANMRKHPPKDGSRQTPIG